VTDHDRLWQGGVLVGPLERPAQDRACADDGEEGCRNRGDRDRLRGGALDEREVPVDRTEHGEVIERPVPLLPVDMLAVGDLDDRQGAPVIALPDDDDPILFGNRERTQDHGFDNGVHAGDRADRQREQRRARSGHAPVAHQRSERLPDDSSHEASMVTRFEAGRDSPCVTRGRESPCIVMRLPSPP
jgi:hypothetical protein